MKKVTLITLLILIIDQSLKIYIKTHFKIGDTFPIIGIFKILFVENPGMAFGIYIGNGFLYKIILTNLRLFICIYIFIWIYKNIKKNKSKYLIISLSMILAGATSNIIDNMFYGIIFDKGMYYSNYFNEWRNYYGISSFSSKGYSFFMGGCVVDMISIKKILIPTYIPIFGGKFLNLFNPIFNIADISISFGIGIIVLFYKKIFTKNSYSFFWYILNSLLSLKKKLPIGIIELLIILLINNKKKNPKNNNKDPISNIPNP